MLTSAAVALTASLTVSNTGLSKWVCPPFPGVTPPTTCVPYSIIWVAWKVPSLPVNPCTITLEFLLTSTLMGKFGYGWNGGEISLTIGTAENSDGSRAFGGVYCG